MPIENEGDKLKRIVKEVIVGLNEAKTKGDRGELPDWAHKVVSDSAKKLDEALPLYERPSRSVVPQASHEHVDY